MVKVHVNGNKYNVATSFKDVKSLEALMECNTVFKELQVVTDIPYELLTMMNETQMFAISHLTGFLDSLDDLEYFCVDVEVVDIQTESYEKFELARQGMVGKLYQQLYKIAKVYYPEEKNTQKLLSIGYKLYVSIAKFLEIYKEMYEKTADDDEIAAGVERLNAFGPFAVAYNLAGRDLLKLNEILAQPLLSVYTALHFNFIEAQYMTALHEIRYPTKLKS